ncbi:MAG: 4-hydroxy-3-methylbut-2-enyl diphosphate reductase [bacterium]
MKIIVGKNAGFCYGVENAVNSTKKILKEEKKIDIIGEIVHNQDVINELESLGLNIIESEKEAIDKVIIRAHGTTKEVYSYLENKKIKIYDYTCPKVLIIHNLASKLKKEGYSILLLGSKKHPENIGTISYCGEGSQIVENKDDIEKFLDNNTNKKIALIVQTTHNYDNYIEVKEYLELKLKEKDIDFYTKNTICSATSERQEEVKELSKKVDTMIIVGGKKSSNTTKLYKIALENCKNTMSVENEKDIDLEKIFGEIGVMAGASTSKDTVLKVIEKIKKNVI